MSIERGGSVGCMRLAGPLLFALPHDPDEALHREWACVSTRPSKILNGLVVALFWIAQIQGIAHAISHIRAGQGYQDEGPIGSLICAECIAVSQAGAAPVASDASPAIAQASTERPVEPTAAAPASDSAVGFRSRAPPVALT